MQAAPTRPPEKRTRHEAPAPDPAERAAVSPAHATAGMPLFLQRAVRPGAAPPAAAPSRRPAEAEPAAPALEIGEAGGVLEREAEAVAERAASARAAAPPAAPPPPDAPRGGPGASSPSPRLRPPGAGEPLAEGVRARVEPVLGADLGGVRVHTGPAVARVARSLGARAFTHGSDVWLGAGESPLDARLLAHEAAHVVQQGAAGAGAPPIQRQEIGPPAPAPAPPEPGGETITHGGRELSTSPAYLRWVLEQVVTERGPRAAWEYVDSLSGAIRARTTRRVVDVVDVPGGTRPVYEDPTPEAEMSPADQRWLRMAREIVPVLEAQRTTLQRENDTFLATFETQARLLVGSALSRSEERSLSEQQRYGLASTTTHDVYDAPGGMRAHTETTHAMADNAGSRGLGTAARELAGKLRAIRDLRDQRAGLERTRCAPRTDLCYETISDPALHASLGTRIEDARRDYLVARHAREAAYPILAAFGSDGVNIDGGTIGSLETVASSPSSGTAEVLNREVGRTLGNIRQVREALENGELKVWKLPNIVALTKQRMGMAPGSYGEKVVDDKVAREADAGQWTALALGVLAVGLGLLAAIPTGGSSLVAGVAAAGAIGAAGVSSYIAVEHLREYQLQAAANGTDFDKAQAISLEEPSLFWLALDIVGAGLDVVAAGAAFRALRTLAREAIAARRAAAAGGAVPAGADDAVRRLTEEAERLAPGSGRRIADDLGRHAGSGAADAEGALAHWDETLNPETRAFLADNPHVRATYAEMDPQVRGLLSHCASICILPNVTRAQVARVRALLDRLGEGAVAVGPEHMYRLKVYFHVSGGDMDWALRFLEANVHGADDIDRALAQGFRRRAMDTGVHVDPTVARN
ncbi:MAG TPA: DUF4157 domain-containing protein, partial [Longimicrobium sp.]|nr:DUF4157 domain-containing protein [Longimicrobium sp.]